MRLCDKGDAFPLSTVYIPPLDSHIPLDVCYASIGS